MRGNPRIKNKSRATGARLLLVANDLHHPLGHRIQELLPFFERGFSVDVFSLVPPGIDKNTTQICRDGWLKGWPRRVLARRDPIIWQNGGYTLIRRWPLPSGCGPAANLLLLLHALRRSDLHSYDICLAQGPVAGRALQQLGYPFVYDHADNYHGGRVDPLHRYILGVWQDQSIRLAQAVACAGMSLVEHATQLNAANARLMPNGVHLERFSGARSESEQPSIIFVGGLESDCGLDMVIRALAAMPVRPDLAVAGTGSAQKDLKRLAQRLGVASSISWLGKVPGEEVPLLLSRAWLGVAPFSDSLWNRYAFHLKIVEYMAAGLPFITSAVGDARTTAEHTGAGVAVQPEPEEVARAMEDLLSSREKLSAMSRLGRSSAESYDWNAIGEEYVNWLNESMAT